MTSVKRLVQARKKQADAAAERLAEERRRLEQLRASRDRLIEDFRRQLSSSDHDATISVARLESFDAARRAASTAADRSAVLVDSARREVIECQLRLRQVEILRDRQQADKRTEEARRERRLLDDLVRGDGPLSSLLILVLALTLAPGCTQQAAAVAPAPTSCPKVAAAPTCPDKRFSKEELVLLRQLRGRKQKLDERARALSQREQRLTAMQHRVDDALESLRRLQHRLDPGKANDKELDKTGRPVKAAPSTPSDVAEGSARAHRTTVATTAAGNKASAPSKAKRARSQLELVAVVRGMNTRAAGAMLAEMTPPKVAALLAQLGPKRVGQLLAQLPAEHAGLVATAMGSRDGPAKPAKPSKPAKAPPGEAKAREPRSAPPATSETEQPRAARATKRPGAEG